MADIQVRLLVKMTLINKFLRLSGETYEQMFHVYFETNSLKNGLAVVNFDRKFQNMFYILVRIALTSAIDFCLLFNPIRLGGRGDFLTQFWFERSACTTHECFRQKKSRSFRWEDK